MANSVPLILKLPDNFSGFPSLCLIMNVEALSTKKGKQFAEKFLSCHQTLMAIDESTTIKNPGAIRTKTIVDIGRNVSYKRILTGSPVYLNETEKFKEGGHDDITLDEYTYYDEDD